MQLMRAISHTLLLLVITAGCSNQQSKDNADPQNGSQGSQQLNLSLPKENNLGMPQYGQTNDSPKLVPAVLPNLFDEKEDNTKISGQLIVDEESEHYRDAVKGAQISIEIKTDTP